MPSMTGSESFFDALKSHRESQNIEIAEICEFTKISPKYIEAIEILEKRVIDVSLKKKNDNNPNFIQEIKVDLTKSIGPGFNFRRVENVGPKVSAELLKSGIIAIGLSLAAMLFYIWIRFEWQFSLGSIIALLHDVITVSYTHLTLPTILLV